MPPLKSPPPPPPVKKWTVPKLRFRTRPTMLMLFKLVYMPNLSAALTVRGSIPKKSLLKAGTLAGTHFPTQKYPGMKNFEPLKILRSSPDTFNSGVISSQLHPREYLGVYATTTTATRTAKKAMDLDKQNNNFARASRFFVHFSAVVARLQRETA